MFETVTIDTDKRGVATLTLNRPDKHNAMSAQMLADLTAAAAQLAADDRVRVVVLTGAGASFCAGAIWAGCATSVTWMPRPGRRRRASWRICWAR